MKNCGLNGGLQKCLPSRNISTNQPPVITDDSSLIVELCSLPHLSALLFDGCDKVSEIYNRVTLKT